MFGTAPNVLVVDDNEGHRQLLGAILRSQGGRVTLAEDGRQAVECARLEYFDLIFMDFDMPHLDGMAAISLIRDNEKKLNRPHVKIVISTSHESIEERRRARAVGADIYITKPFDLKCLVMIANNYCELRELSLTPCGRCVGTACAKMCDAA